MSIAADTVLRHIEHGLFDERLSDLEKAVEKRLSKVRSSRNVEEYGVGDSVVFNDLCGTTYLRGQIGTVVGKERSRVLVKLRWPIGRFAQNVEGKWESTSIKAPPSIIDHVK